MKIKDIHLEFYKDKNINWVNWGKYFYNDIKELNLESVCDVGCGNGQFLVDMVEDFDFKKAFGVDIATIDLNMVIKNDNISYLSSDSSNIDITSKSVDLLTSFDCLEHVSENEIENTLEEFNRVCKKYFMFSISHRYSGEKINNHNLHSCVKSKQWWIDKISNTTKAELIKLEHDGSDRSLSIWKLKI